MPDWTERITRDGPPAVRAEHELRYRAAAPLIATSRVWADLGCGSGVAAAISLSGRFPGHAVLVDLDANVVSAAARELGAPDVRQLVGDLTNPDDLACIGEILLGFEGERIVSCFEVLEHLRTFVPLLEWSSALAREGAVTFVISVPNDAFWSIENPYHATSWGEGSFEELQLLLPAERTLFRQLSVIGSAIVGWERTPERHDVVLELGGGSVVPTHFLAAFGPRHGELQRAAVAFQQDLLEARRWERQRESNLAVAEARVAQHTVELDDWRRYIHELERGLGKAPSGSGDGVQADYLDGAESRRPDSDPTESQT